MSASEAPKINFNNTGTSWFRRKIEFETTAAIESPIYEKLGHRGRSNISYCDFGKSKGRDNVMYDISDGFNLRKFDNSHPIGS
jgi:hypothetical protein